MPMSNNTHPPFIVPNWTIVCQKKKCFMPLELPLELRLWNLNSTCDHKCIENWLKLVEFEKMNVLKRARWFLRLCADIPAGSFDVDYGCPSSGSVPQWFVVKSKWMESNWSALAFKNVKLVVCQFELSWCRQITF